MTKADLAAAICENVGGFTKKEAAELTDIVFETMKNSIANEGTLKITGFGTFMVRSKNPRMGRNPQSGKEMIIESRKVLSFRPSQILKGMVKNS